MFGSIYIGLSGLNAYSQGLKTVSHNVSNMNTPGFKASDVSFSDIYGARSAGGLAYGAGYTGQGHGVSFDSTTIDFRQGELRETGRDLDLAVDGNGFLVLLDGDATYYTRTGSFIVDDEGYVILSGTDYRLGVLDESGHPAPLNIDAMRSSPPQKTTKVTFSDNLSSTATSYTASDIKVYDERGGEHVWKAAFSREETVFDEWTVKITDADGNEIGTETLHVTNGMVLPDNAKLTFADADEGLSVEFDFGKITSYSSGTVSTLRATDIDGRAAGTITTLIVNDKGQFELTYSNEGVSQNTLFNNEKI